MANTHRLFSLVWLYWSLCVYPNDRFTFKRDASNSLSAEKNCRRNTYLKVSVFTLIVFEVELLMQ